MKSKLLIFENITNIKIKQYKYLKKGITNDNYLINQKYVLRIPKDNQIGLNRENEEKIIKALKNIDVPLIYFDKNTGIKITKYIPNRGYNKFPSLKKVKLFIFQLKKIHKIKIDNIEEFDPFKLIILYKKHANITFINEDKVINAAKILYTSEKKVLCHNDLLYANILFSNKKAYIIDYEYAAKNIELFDVVSFLSENNIDNTKKQLTFLKLYYKKITPELLNNFHTMYLLLDLLWGYWAYAMYNLCNDEKYFKIAELKHQRYLSKIYNF